MDYILWINYGCDGWTPKYYNSKEDMIKGIINGDTSGYEFIITKKLNLTIELPKE